MPANDGGRGGGGTGGSSGFMAFWTSLPGILTGAAALITAVATLAALDVGDGDSGQTSTGLPARFESTVTAGFGEAGCLRRYFGGIPFRQGPTRGDGNHGFRGDRREPAESGSDRAEVHQPQRPDRCDADRVLSGQHAVQDRVDRRPACARIADYSNVGRGGDANVLQNWDTVRSRFDGDLYDLRIGASTTISINFEAYVP